MFERAVVKRQVKKEIKEAEDNPTTDSTTNQGDGGTEGPKHSTDSLDGAAEETKGRRLLKKFLFPISFFFIGFRLNMKNNIVPTSPPYQQRRP
jgi:hypothetical protein